MSFDDKVFEDGRDDEVVELFKSMNAEAKNEQSGSAEIAEVEAISEAPKENDWELLTATSDVPAELYIRTNFAGQIEVKFSMYEDKLHFEMMLEDFLLCFRLFNMVWYSPLMKHLNLCINSACANKPFGGHVRKDNCLPMSDYQEMLQRDNENRLRELPLHKSREESSIPRNPSN